jgi:two-component system response regulator HydG
MSEALPVLVVDDDQRMAKTLADILKAKEYQAETAHSGAEALEKMAETAFACVLSDIKMPGVNGVELYQAIKASQPDLPVVLMTAYSDDSLVREGLEKGAVAALTKPLDIGMLLGFLSFLRQERSVVIVDDDDDFCRTLGDILRARGFAATHIADPHQVMEGFEAEGDVVLLDMKLNTINGLDVLRTIREQYPRLPVILVTGYREEMAPAIEAALELNAYTCLYKPVEIENLLEVLSQVRHRQLSRVLGGD